MPALARLPGKRVRSSEWLLNYETVSNRPILVLIRQACLTLLALLIGAAVVAAALWSTFGSHAAYLAATGSI